MSGFYTEADYENSIIELFQNMGYRYVYAPDLERDFRSPLYEEAVSYTHLDVYKRQGSSSRNRAMRCLSKSRSAIISSIEGLLSGM